MQSPKEEIECIKEEGGRGGKCGGKKGTFVKGGRSTYCTTVDLCYIHNYLAENAMMTHMS